MVEHYPFFLLTSDQHRRQRKMLNPVFSIAYMREMGASSLAKGSLLLIQRISSNFLRHRSQGSCSPITLSLSLIHIQLRVFITNQVRDGPQEVWFNYPSIFFSWKILYFDTQIELLSWMTRTALELIGQSGFGYSFDSMTETSVPHLYALSVKRYVWVLFLHAT